MSRPVTKSSVNPAASRPAGKSVPASKLTTTSPACGSRGWIWRLIGAAAHAQEAGAVADGPPGESGFRGAHREFPQRHARHRVHTGGALFQEDHYLLALAESGRALDDLVQIVERAALDQD